MMKGNPWLVEDEKNPVQMEPELGLRVIPR
jgi:hypothetical protein